MRLWFKAVGIVLGWLWLIAGLVLVVVGGGLLFTAYPDIALPIIGTLVVGFVLFVWVWVVHHMLVREEEEAEKKSVKFDGKREVR